MSSRHLRVAVATLGGADLAQPFVCEDLDTLARLEADVYVGCGVSLGRHRQAWWRKMREAGLATFHRRDDTPVSTRIPVLHTWTAALRLDLTPAVLVTGARVSARCLERSRGRGVTSIIAGELGRRTPAYHPAQVVVGRRGTIGIVVVPAPEVVVRFSGDLGLPATQLHSEAPVLAADLDLGPVTPGWPLREARGSASAPDAAPWPPRRVDRGVRAGR